MYFLLLGDHKELNQTKLSVTTSNPHEMGGKAETNECIGLFGPGSYRMWVCMGRIGAPGTKEKKQRTVQTQENGFCWKLRAPGT